MAIDIVGSKFPAENGYGQNGYSGPSSTLPKDGDSDPSRIRIENLGGKPVADVTVPDDVTARIDKDPAGWQTRTVKAEQYPTAFGHHKANMPTEFPTSNNRYTGKPAPGSAKSSVPAKVGNFSRG
jgi:hypothetical protein